VLVAGGSGSGKTIAFASIVRALAEHRRRVVTLEDPIELVHPTPWVSQREVGAHVASIAAGVGHAMREGADAIAVGGVDSSEAALALVDAIAGNHFVVTTIVAPVSSALDRFVDLLPAERRERGRLLAGHALLGTVACRGNRSVEVIRPDRRG
jgi:twitching motility protein PilT